MNEPEVKVLMLKGNKGDGLTDDDMRQVKSQIDANSKVLNSRIDNLILASGNESSAEVIDARTGYDGKAYDTLGTAIRTQANDINEDLNNFTTTNYDVSNNRFDNVYGLNGYINNSSGDFVESASYKVTNKFYQLFMGDLEYVNVHCSVTTDTLVVCLYDIDKNYLGKIKLDNTLLASGHYPKAYYFKVYTNENYSGQVYVSPIKQDTGYYEFSLTKNILVKENSVENLNNYMKKSDIPQPLNKKKIVNFGDSLFGNFRGSDSISSVLADLTGATVYNCGFGGCNMAYRGDDATNKAWSAFSMCSLADAICSGDWTYQEESKNYGNAPGNTIPSYFADETLPLLKSINFNEIDAITIAYGTNDYTFGAIVDDSEEGFDIKTYLGAFKYSIRKIQETYPNIKILAITPVWRYWSDQENSDNKNYGHGTLLDIKNKLIETSKNMRVPVLDSYSTLSLSYYNANNFFQPNDKTHLNAKGRKWYAELIEGALNNIY